MSVKEGDIGLYFPEGTQISNEFAIPNDLIRRKDKDGNNVGGMFNANRRVITMKLRGSLSEGFWCELSKLECLGPVASVKVGDQFQTFNGKELCKKYVNFFEQKRLNRGQKILSEHFQMKRHTETDQFRVYLNNIEKGQLIIVSAKLHGTSFRVCNATKNRPLKWYEKLINKIFPLDIKQYQLCHGSRNVVLGDNSPPLRERIKNEFVDKLYKSEAIYGECCGFDGTTPIMPTVSNEKLGREFVNKWGKQTVWSYGCQPGQSKLFIYRITRTTEDGCVTELSWEQVKERCAEIGIPTVPELCRFIYDGDKDKLTKLVEELCEGPDLIGNHIREGVCIRIEKAKPKIIKHKNFEFKVLEGICEAPNIEDES